MYSLLKKLYNCQKTFTKKNLAKKRFNVKKDHCIYYYLKFANCYSMKKSLVLKKNSLQMH